MGRWCRSLSNISIACETSEYRAFGSSFLVPKVAFVKALLVSTTKPEAIATKLISIRHSDSHGRLPGARPMGPMGPVRPVRPTVRVLYAALVPPLRNRRNELAPQIGPLRRRFEVAVPPPYCGDVRREGGGRDTSGRGAKRVGEMMGWQRVGRG